MTIALVTVIVSGIGVSCAIIYGALATRNAGRQAELARRATVLSHRPILIPLHEVGWLGRLPEEDDWFPVEHEYQMEEPRGVAPGEVFRVATRGGVPRASVALRNVGDGPALVVRLTVWNNLGLYGEQSGQMAIAAGGDRQFLVPLTKKFGDHDGFAEATDRWRLTRAASEATAAEWAARRDAAVHFIEVEFDDVFDVPPGRFHLRAWFDPNEFGAWRVLSEPSEWIPGTQMTAWRS